MEENEFEVLTDDKDFIEKMKEVFAFQDSTFFGVDLFGALECAKEMEIMEDE